jgi:formamidopyrimidine-DNA glycosylase
MPELPEVELMSRNLQAWCAGRPITGLELDDPKLLLGDRPLTPLLGRTVERARRRGKYAVMDLGDQHLVLHFRMTGKIILLEEVERRFIRLRMMFGSRTVALRDGRRLAEIRLLDRHELAPFFDARLGPEPWPEQRDAAFWSARFAGTRSALKVALLDQARVAGLGNIAGSEICWLAGIDPSTPTDRLGPRHWSAIDAATRRWIEDTLAAEEGPEITLLEESKQAPNPFQVYGREGQPCPRCDEGVIERLVQSGRSTFRCRGCQRRLRPRRR